MAEETTSRGYPLPNPDNIAREDATRIRNAIEAISGDMDTLEGATTVASETVVGGVRFATAAKATAGTATDAVPVVKRVKDMIAAAIALLVDSSPGTLDTLNELAAALNDDPHFAATVSTLIGEKASKAANLSDLTDKAAARTALQLAAAALKGVATAANIRANSGSDVITNDQAWAAAAWVDLGNLTGAVTIDANTGIRFRGTLTGNVTVDVSNLKNGQAIEVVLSQDATGGRTIAWNGKFKWPSASAPGISTAANTIAVVVTGIAFYDGTILGAGWKVTA